jgi:hypothetical protein
MYISRMTDFFVKTDGKLSPIQTERRDVCGFIERLMIHHPEIEVFEVGQKVDMDHHLKSKHHFAKTF